MILPQVYIGKHWYLAARDAGGEPMNTCTGRNSCTGSFEICDRFHYFIVIPQVGFKFKAIALNLVISSCELLVVTRKD